jgi:hypothetical protein
MNYRYYLYYELCISFAAGRSAVLVEKKVSLCISLN